MDNFALEICTDSLESVLEAERGGADRIELCSNLVIGGTTPSESLFREIKKYSNIRIHVLIRPRFGDFCYTEHEYHIIKEEIQRFKALGADGVVIGILRKDGSLDTERMEELMQQAEGMSVTLHRAFDVCRDPFETMEQAVRLGIDRILTSGQKDSCDKGIALLAELQKQSAGRIRLLAGAGISAEVIPAIYEQTGITEYHMSGKVVLDSPMEYRKEDVNMGLPFMSEFEIYRTDAREVEKAKKVLESLKG